MANARIKQAQEYVVKAGELPNSKHSGLKWLQKHLPLGVVVSLITFLEQTLRLG
jgi:hypothetical protein